ncbi:phosphohistidine phosphatase SixA [Oceanisphaera avium]|uniref:Phosphohistidine phosphatase SixA n=1 Tax=Oceanisphaera avium TaxID=1903694 RepID=A0A1Y0D1W5_9GAMM|nr:phosphohistidine phosphatase SixA [Oceanisphaera avium]ART81095.1 phosphohistidine phosphatase SixA [Oceanisphaera avium]
MNIFIMRHGQATPDAFSDAVRPLTEQGIDEVSLMARWLAPQVPHFDLVLVSPYLRAQQTWQQMATIIPASHVETCDELTPNCDADLSASLVLAHASAYPNGNILVVSHMPMVGYLVESLCAGMMAPIFVTSGIANISLKAGSGGILSWLEGPHNIQALYKPTFQALRSLG